RVATLPLAQAAAIRIEDNLIISGELKKESSKSKSSDPSPTTSSDPAFQKMANDLLALKKQLAQASPSSSYRDAPRRNFVPNNASQRPRLPATAPRLALEAPPVNALAEIEEEEQYYEEPSSQGEDDQDVGEPTGDSTIGYMEFDEDESDEEESTQGYASGQSYAVFTRSQGKEAEVAAHVQKEKVVSN
ncbi:hypothetical protein KI387_000449, partial [Taxus chinensis]